VLFLFHLAAEFFRLGSSKSEHILDDRSCARAVDNVVDATTIGPGVSERVELHSKLICPYSKHHKQP
jgi:hypothetical protein